jgi:hypothetical protein
MGIEGRAAALCACRRKCFARFRFAKIAQAKFFKLFGRWALGDGHGRWAWALGMGAGHGRERCAQKKKFSREFFF